MRGDMAQQLKSLDATKDKLSSIPETYMMERDNWLTQGVQWLHTHNLVCESLK